MQIEFKVISVYKVSKVLKLQSQTYLSLEHFDDTKQYRVFGFGKLNFCQCIFLSRILQFESTSKLPLITGDMKN